MSTDNGLTGGDFLSSLYYWIHESFTSTKKSGEAEEEKTNRPIGENYILPH